MPDLSAAHRGYEYQDLLVACRLVDVMLGNLVDVQVDRKLVVDDRFDDLTVEDAAGRRCRAQFKHTDNDDRPLTLDTFTTDRRGLRLDKIAASALAYRGGLGANASDIEFRVVLRDARPADEKLLAVLRPANPDPGPFVPALGSYRLRFDAECVWVSNPHDTWSDLFSSAGIDEEDLRWVCERLVVEVEAPPASWDLLRPGPAEQLLLDRLRSEVGAGSYPNALRSPPDVADALVRASRGARHHSVVVSWRELMRRTQLRHDFGAVARRHPVDAAVEVLRGSAIRSLADAAATGATTGQTLLITGPPGQGKSWACQQLIEHLQHEGWMVAEHYCYLGDADGERDDRVLAESVFGSLLARLAEKDPAVIVDHRPRFAADEDAVVAAVRTALSRDPARRVALIVDGIDHVTRVRADGRAGPDPSRSLCAALAGLEIPDGSILVVLSQPGGHLQPLRDNGAAERLVPGMTRVELAQLAAALDVMPGSTGAPGPALVTDNKAAEILDALHRLSAGNALYATYLCREMIRRADNVADPMLALTTLPVFDGTLENYYRHVHDALPRDSSWVADTIALVDFSLTRNELQAINPAAAHRVDAALDALQPVLIERSTQGGIRVYHESFARFLRRSFRGHEEALNAQLELVIRWLHVKGMFDDIRAFRSLLPLLAAVGRDREVVDHVDGSFVVKAVAAGIPVSAILEVLIVGVGSAVRIGDWPAVVRMIELSRAAATLEWERYDTTVVQFADVLCDLLGADTVAQRLLHDGSTVMPARIGIQMCAAVDELGAVAPWHEYIDAYIAEAQNDDTIYGSAADRVVRTALLRGQLRLSAQRCGSDPDLSLLVDAGEATSAGSLADDGPHADGVVAAVDAPVDWHRLAAMCDRGDVTTVDMIAALADTYGSRVAVAVKSLVADQGDYSLALAEATADKRLPGDLAGAQEWARRAASHGLPAGSLLRLHPLDIDVLDLADDLPGYDRAHFLNLTRQVQSRSVIHDGRLLPSWLDGCVHAAAVDSLGVDAAESLIAGPGWYRCWLRFVLALTLAQAGPATARSGAVLDAIRLLHDDLDTGTGDLRVVDLLPVEGFITDTVRRALLLVDEHDWTQALLLLDEVSQRIFLTFRGELGGPLGPDVLLQLASDTVPSTQMAAVAELAAANAEARSGGRFYGDLAEFRLAGARIALARGDRTAAKRLWEQACQLLVAYGWHKDITIYELLEPLPALIAADAARARERLAAVQPLCARIPRHTDGKETHNAPGRWWELLAAADPTALAALTTPAALARCNDPHRLFDDARGDLWSAWHHAADPVVAGALRLSVALPLDDADPALLRRLLAVTANDDGFDAARQLAISLLARTDERPYRYAYSNGDEQVARDRSRVAAINAVVGEAVPPAVLALPEPIDEPEPGRATPPFSNSRARRQLCDHQLVRPASPAYPTGVVGLARAVRAWRTRPYVDAMTFDDTVNALGYRLLEVAQAGHLHEAAAALRSIASDVNADDSALLTALADGLARHGEDALAATAYTLAWTRSRGGRGWLSFGGESELGSLRRAHEIDSSVSLSVVGEEIQQHLRHGRGTAWGLTQALVIAFASGALAYPRELPADTAFRAWDQAHAVISARAPHTHPTDDADQPYRPTTPQPGPPSCGEVNAALATTTIAGLASASREAKRNGLLATAVLLRERPGCCAPGVRLALTATSDVATLSWLLRTLLDTADPESEALAESSAVLAALAMGPELPIRAMARRLLAAHARPPLAPPNEADPELVADSSTALWVPPEQVLMPSRQPAHIVELVRHTVGHRLDAAETMLPGLTRAVERRVSEAFTDPARHERMGTQIRAFAGVGQDRWPDAYLGIYESVETALQRSAGGGRAAWLRCGHPIGDPPSWEDDLAHVLVDDPATPLALEATRRPRPNLPPPPGRGDPLWATADSTEGGPARSSDAAAHRAPGELVFVAEHGPGADPPVAWSGWLVLASFEQLRSFPRWSESRTQHLSTRISAVELDGADRDHEQVVSPFALGALTDWLAPVVRTNTPSVPAAAHPLVALDRDLVAAGDTATGLGVPAAICVPTRLLIEILGLDRRQDAPFVLQQDGLDALTLITWRSLYEDGGRHLPQPRLTGSAILIRRTAYEHLAQWAQGRLVRRDYVFGGPTD